MTHQPSPIWKHLEQRFVSLGDEALKRTRVYLDTNFWAMLRDHQAGRRERADVGRLLSVLREATTSEVAICTFSGHTLSELMKHQDASIRHLTAELMDELSNGICLANPDRLLNNEIISLVSSLFTPSMDRWPVSQLAWTKPFFLMIDYEPPNSSVTDEENLSIQKGFVDHVWTMPMTDLLKTIHASREPYPSLTWPEDAAQSINSEMRNFDHENKTLHDFYLSELRGLLEWAKPRLIERYCEFVSRYNLGSRPIGRIKKDVCGDTLLRKVIGLARRKELAGRMPSVHVRSMMHAMIRFDRSRKFKANDLIDIEHAETSLPHCNLFLTDKPNAHLIRSAKLDVEFGCVICDSPAQATNEIGRLLI